MLREKARLLDLTHDTIFVRDMDNVITYWNRGAEELYGWTADEVVGKVTTHQLLRTVFPARLEEIDAELLRTGRWEGELRHTKQDGTQIVVASRWSLQRDARQSHLRPKPITTSPNASVRKSLRQAQTDLTHISRVTTMGELTASWRTK
jgi:PAS domain S-box-containing protein